MAAKINPFNFVPLGPGPTRAAWSDTSKHHRLQDDSYSGYLTLKLTALTPIVIPSRKSLDIEQSLRGCSERCRRERKEKTTFKRFHSSNGLPTIPGTSVKGMVRTVFEALTDSCMTLFAGTYKNKKETKAKTNNGVAYPAAEHAHDLCGKDGGLCPACTVFGTIKGDLLYQGKVCISDATGRTEDIESVDWVLKELSSPKPGRHPPFYALNGCNPSTGPRGRKFYYHHDPAALDITQSDHNHRNRRIEECIRRFSVLTSSISFHNLTEIHLSALLYSLELDAVFERMDNGTSRSRRSLAHKIGMAKPLGLGSLAITITDGDIWRGASRYRSWDPAPGADLRITISALKAMVPDSPVSLRDLLGLRKHREGSIEYPGLPWFRANSSQSLTDSGVFLEE